MTEKLKTLMDEVTGMVDQDFAAPDLDVIIRDGDRTVRRRRVAAGIAGLAAAAVAVGGVALATGGLGPDDTRVADTPVDSEGMSWATGSVLHTPASGLDVGHVVRAYVRTTAGFVTVDETGRVRSVVGDEVVEVGRMEASSLHLASDTEDSLAAWLEQEPDGGWSWVVYDQDLGRRLATFERGPAPDVVGVLVTIDERQLVVSEQGGYRSFDVDDGTETVIDRPVRSAQLLSVEDGVLTWADPDEDGGSSAYLVGRTEMAPVRIPAVQGTIAVLSPDARWVTFDADEPRVFDTATGEQVGIDLDGRFFGAGYEWLDDDSLAVIASRGEVGPIELLVCEVPSGACAVVAPDLGSFDDALERGFALPGGRAIDD